MPHCWSHCVPESYPVGYFRLRLLKNCWILATAWTWWGAGTLSAHCLRRTTSQAFPVCNRDFRETVTTHGISQLRPGGHSCEAEG